MSKKKGELLTAAELMAQLDDDPEFHAAAAARDEALDRKLEAWSKAEAPLRDDLRSIGLEVSSAWDLPSSGSHYDDALPMLVEYLERRHYPDRVREGIARALAVPGAAVYWARLERLFREARGPDEEMGLAATLAVIATEEHFRELVALVHLDDRGGCRSLFLQPIFEIGGQEGRAVVESLVEHPLLGWEARAVLGLQDRRG